MIDWSLIDRSSNELTLHVSRGSNNDKELARLYSTFSVIADQMNIPFNVVNHSLIYK